MLTADVEFYIAELKRVLSSDGLGLVTAFTYESVDSSVELLFFARWWQFPFRSSGVP
jgi:hypothetical protein